LHAQPRALTADRLDEDEAVEVWLALLDTLLEAVSEPLLDCTGRACVWDRSTEGASRRA
jgi:hypothetical protein